MQRKSNKVAPDSINNQDLNLLKEIEKQDPYHARMKEILREKNLQYSDDEYIAMDAMSPRTYFEYAEHREQKRISVKNKYDQVKKKDKNVSEGCCLMF